MYDLKLVLSRGALLRDAPGMTHVQVNSKEEKKKKKPQSGAITSGRVCPAAGAS